MRRRAFLGAIGAGAFAGCSGGDPDPAVATIDEGTPTEQTPTVLSSSSPSTTPPATGPSPPHKGVSLSPRSFEAADFEAFIEQASLAGTALRWAGDWAELAEPGGAPAVVARLAREHGLAAAIDTGVFSVSQDDLFRPLTREHRERFLDAVAGFAAEHAPAYLGLGVEVDRHYESDPDSFETFVDLFAETRAAVADAAPETAVSVTFQYEHLRGLQGGLFGGENDPDAALWNLLHRFPATDVVGLTTYPGLVFRDPTEVPAEYFAPVADRIDRPVAVTETGWSAETVAEGWETDEAEQAAFAQRLFDLVEPLAPELLLWLWLYDQPTAEPAFAGMGLRRDDGSARPAWDAWLDGEL